MQIEYRAFEKSLDYLQQRRLFSLSFPEAVDTPVETDAHFAWKFESYPASPPAYQYVAAEPTDIVGYYAALPFTYSLDGVKSNCAMVCDVMTHPERRGLGIFSRIGRFATDALQANGLGFTTGYPIRSEVIPGHIKVGWKKVKTLPVYLRVLGVRSFLPRAFGFLAPMLDPVLRLIQACSVPAPSGYTTEVLSREAFLECHSKDDSEYTMLLGTWAGQQGNILLKTCPFLRWRTGAPGTEYLFVTLRHQGSLVGLAIARPVPMKGVETLALLDFMVLPEHARGSTALHQQLCRAAREYRMDAVACMCSRESAKIYRFASSGYLRTHLVFTLIVKKLDQGIADQSLYSAHRWNPFWLDSDDL